MNEELEFETYLSISPNEFSIYLFNTKNHKNLYKEVFKFESKKEIIDFKSLAIFLEDNIFKIEKLVGKFIKNISLIIENSKVINIGLGIKKKIIKEILIKLI